MPCLIWCMILRQKLTRLNEGAIEMVVYLIGMMGSGKTTLGKKVSDQLNCPWVDLDQFIEKTTGVTTSKYIQEYGIDHFRVVEAECLKQLNIRPLIVSCGGGTILSEDNVRFMKSQGFVVYLKCQVDTLVKRLQKTDLTTRPLLQGDALRERLMTLEKEREDCYEKAAHTTIICDQKSIDEVCEELILFINSRLKHMN